MRTSPAPASVTHKIVLRHPDWITCRQWITGVGPCGTINLVGDVFPVRCVRCGHAL